MSRRAARSIGNAADMHARGPLSIVDPVLTRRVKSSVVANLGVLKQILEH